MERSEYDNDRSRVPPVRPSKRPLDSQSEYKPVSNQPSQLRYPERYEAHVPTHTKQGMGAHTLKSPHPNPRYTHTHQLRQELSRQEWYVPSQRDHVPGRDQSSYTNGIDNRAQPVHQQRQPGVYEGWKDTRMKPQSHEQGSSPHGYQIPQHNPRDSYGIGPDHYVQASQYPREQRQDGEPIDHIPIYQPYPHDSHTYGRSAGGFVHRSPPSSSQVHAQLKQQYPGQRKIVMHGRDNTQRDERYPQSQEPYQQPGESESTKKQPETRIDQLVDSIFNLYRYPEGLRLPLLEFDEVWEVVGSWFNKAGGSKTTKECKKQMYGCKFGKGRPAGKNQTKSVIEPQRKRAVHARVLHPCPVGFQLKVYSDVVLFVPSHGAHRHNHGVDVLTEYRLLHKIRDAIAKEIEKGVSPDDVKKFIKQEYPTVNHEAVRKQVQYRYNQYRRAGKTKDGIATIEAVEAAEEALGPEPIPPPVRAVDAVYSAEDCPSDDNLVFDDNAILENAAALLTIQRPVEQLTNVKTVESDTTLGNSSYLSEVVPAAVPDSERTALSAGVTATVKACSVNDNVSTKPDSEKQLSSKLPNVEIYSSTSSSTCASESAGSTVKAAGVCTNEPASDSGVDLLAVGTNVCSTTKALVIDDAIDVTAEVPSLLDVMGPIRELLDTRHARRERIIKASRDITIASKKVIFHLHRVTQCKTDEEKNRIVAEARDKLKDVRTLIGKGLATDLQSSGSRCLFAKQYSPGLQEYVEASSLYYYLQDSTLVSITTLREELKFSSSRVNGEGGQNMSDNGDSQTYIPISISDYLLGIADLSGELMRLSINYLGVGNRTAPFTIMEFLRGMLDAYESMSYESVKELGKKIHVMKQSLAKVENACYAVAIRGTEVPEHMIVAMAKQRDITPADNNGN
eukprot:CFRG0527T1